MTPLARALADLRRAAGSIMLCAGALAVGLAGGLSSLVTAADLDTVSLDRELAALPGAVRGAVGVTREGAAIAVVHFDGAVDPRVGMPRVLLVGGLDGTADSVAATLRALRSFAGLGTGATPRHTVALSAIVCGAGDPEGPGRDLTRGYPPSGTAYTSESAPEAQYVWRWTGLHAPDLVVVVGAAEASAWRAPSGDAPPAELVAALGATSSKPAADSLAAALSTGAPAAVGSVPALEWRGPPEHPFLSELLVALQSGGTLAPSPARAEALRRMARTPVEVAAELAAHYGRALDEVHYIPALAVIGRLRLGGATGDPSHRADALRLVRGFLRGEVEPKRDNGSQFAGHLVFAALADVAEGDERTRCIDLVRGVADLGFDETGRPREVMPAHSQMSDAVFMGGPILCQAGRLTGQRRYFDACARHVRFMTDLNRREDGLHRHSPLDSTAWGRGNGFPALGLALVLTDFPVDHPDRAALLEIYVGHMDALRAHQDVDGSWHQVIDRPESYRELTATCMITFAMLRGVRRGWLDEAVYRPVVERAWTAILRRVGRDGELVDVCAGTGKQRDLRAYLERPAILGRDARGGAMALLVATEMAAWGRAGGGR